MSHADLSPDIYNDVVKKLQKDTAKHTYINTSFYVTALRPGQLCFDGSSFLSDN